MNKRVLAARGAVTIEESQTRSEEAMMVEALGRLMDELCLTNNISIPDIISLQFTQTSDLKRKNAAAALRTARPAYSQVPLFCSAEPDVEGSMPRTVRVLVNWMGTGTVKAVYIGEASKLRPDLTG